MTTRSETPRASASGLVPAPRPGDALGQTPTFTSPAGDVLLAHLREQVQQVHAYDRPVRMDAPDAVHKMRVAVRRLRSALTTFAPLVPGDVRRPLGKELKWLAGVLGEARDAEVLRDRVRKSLEREGEGADAATAVVDAELEQAYRAAHDRVLVALDGERYAT